MDMPRRLAAEFIGTFWIVLGGCGSMILAAPAAGTAALAFGFAVVTGTYAFAHVSGAHFNPAITLGLWAGGRFPLRDVVPYGIAQVAGALAAGAVLFAIASGAAGFEASANFASNGYGEHSPQDYSLLSVLICESVLSFLFVLVTLGATALKAPKGFAPLAVGLAFALVSLASFPVTGASVNPARSTGVAVFQGGWALGELWAFWAASLAGAWLAGAADRWLADEKA